MGGYTKSLSLILLVGAGFWAGHISTATVDRASAAPGPYAQFAGSWATHAGVLSIAPDGHGYLQLRAYVWCDHVHITACDRIIKRKNATDIYSGRYADFTLEKITGTTATGTITNSSYSWEIRTPISFKLGKARTVHMTTIEGAGNVFCGARWQPECGA